MYIYGGAPGAGAGGVGADKVIGPGLLYHDMDS